MRKTVSPTIEMARQNMIKGSTFLFLVVCVVWTWSSSKSSSNPPTQFRLNLDDEDGAEVQAMMFCAEHMRSDDDVDVCVSKVLEQVYAKAPHLRPDSEEETHTNKAQEKKLNFVLQPGQDPVKETESFCRAEVLPKDVEWCQRELLKQVYAQAPQLRTFDESTSSCEMDGNDSSINDDIDNNDNNIKKKKKLKNIARGHPVSANSDDGSNYITSVIDGCKTDCFLSWCSDPKDSSARITLDLEEPHCVRAVKLFWDEEFTPGKIKIRGNQEELLLSKKNLAKKSNRIDSMRLVRKSHIGIDIDRFMYFDFSEKHADDFDLIELQVFGRVGHCDDKKETKKETTNPKIKEDTVIVIVAYNRPNYLRRVLDNLADCDGIEGYPVRSVRVPWYHSTDRILNSRARTQVHIFIDPADREETRETVKTVAKSFTASKITRVSTHSTRLGPHKNIRYAVNDAFESYDARFVIVLEDDVILSRDALMFMEYARDTFENDTNVFTATGYANNCHREHCVVDPAFRHRTTRRKHFTPWFWGTWRDRWQELHKSTWTGWDVEMNFELSETRSIVQKPNSGLRGERVEVFPIFSRANNIGFENGFHAHVYTPEQMRELQYITCWAGNGCEDGAGGVVQDSSEFSELNDLDSILETIKVA